MTTEHIEQPAAPASPIGTSTETPGSFFAEKFRVQKDDGTVDIEASARRSEQARSHLEKRLGVGDMRPGTAAEYKFELPEDKAPVLAAFGEKGLDDFKAKAHALGLTESQATGILGEMVSMVPAITGDLNRFDHGQAMQELREVWTTPAEFDEGMRASMRAVAAFAGGDAQAVLTRYGNDATFVRMMAGIGREIGEDRAPDLNSPATGDDIGELTKSEAYTNPRHKDHAAVSARVMNFHKARSGHREPGTWR